MEDLKTNDPYSFEEISSDVTNPDRHSSIAALVSLGVVFGTVLTILLIFSAT